MRSKMLPRHPLLTLPLLLLTVMTPHGSEARVRTYYIAAREVLWDYAPNNMTNIINPRDITTPAKFLQRGPDRVGSVYKKAMFLQFTDDTFTQEVTQPPSQGIVGPMIRAEVGDRLEIVYYNMAGRAYSMHPHGVDYNKDAESAIYVDGTSGRDKHDDIVAPGEKVRLMWNVTSRDAPGPRDPACIPWVYHSHVSTPEDTSAGLIGVMLTCRPGTLDANNRRTDVAKEYPLLIKIWDENLSWYAEDNLDLCDVTSECEALVEAEDEAFTESNYMAAINGLMYGHLPGLEACVDEPVAFYVIGMGNEFDIHSLHFHGQNLQYQHTRGDTISVYSATFIAAEMTSRVPGAWPITDMVGDNARNGMSALLHTRDCNGLVSEDPTNPRGPTTEYFLSAEEVMWNYGPSGVDGRSGQPLTTAGSPSEKFFKGQGSSLDYMKAKFVGYTDATFTTRTVIGADEAHMGMMGPVLRTQAGANIRVTLKNNLFAPVSFLPHALSFSSDEEVKMGGNGGAVPPGTSHTYTFHAPDDMFNNSSKPCMTYMYTSGYAPERDQNTGLVGPLVVCQRGAHNKHRDVFLLFQTVDENKSMYSADNSDVIDDPEANFKFGINGFTFGNLPDLTFCLRDKVNWNLMALGQTFDVHTASFDGNNFEEDGNHRDTRALAPGSTASVLMSMDNPGRWVVESHNNLARSNGMYGFYTVQQCGEDLQGAYNGPVREHFIAAVEQDWDYAPTERSVITGRDLNDPRDHANVFFKDDEAFIGGVYKKVVYRAYTDASFTRRKPIATADLHKDLLGPIIRAEVGDDVRVTFRNMASRNYSIHPHGFLYRESSIGTNYHRQGGVAPGQTTVYHWETPPSAGPGARDPNCIPWIYYSAQDPEKDTLSGLYGMAVVCRRGTLTPQGRRRDVDREFFLMMHVLNENLSWYLRDNIRSRAPEREGTDYESDGEFEESNIMHAINGRLSGNTQHLEMELNDTVAWYFASIGAEVDLHSFHLHGHTVLHTSDGHRNDAINIFPGQAEAVEMVADIPGTWLLHCHQLDHIIAGMETTYTVRAEGACPTCVGLTLTPGGRTWEVTEDPSTYSGCSLLTSRVAMVCQALLLCLWSAVLFA